MELSVIIPAYNEEKYIEKTLRALHDTEVIVVCNGCTDRTAEIAGKYAHRIIVLPERGVSRARNAGAATASHQRLVFLDADMGISDDLFQKIAESPFTIGTCKVRPDSDKVFDKVHYAVKSLIHHLGTCTGLLFCDKSIFDQAQGFEEHISTKEDGRFLRRARKLGTFGVVDAYVYNNMRRFRKKGYASIAWFWIREYLFPAKREYECVR